MSTEQPRDRYELLVEELGLGTGEDIRSIEPLTGGVASDIVKVTLDNRSFCLKCALEKLKVEQDWRAPQHRNKAEYAWLEVASGVNPKNAVGLLGVSQQEPCFAMEYIEGDDVYLWKAKLLKGNVSSIDAQNVGDSLGSIHAASSTREFCRQAFSNHDDFYELRLDPYLNSAAARNPQVAGQLHQLVEQLYQADDVLIHGDVSPKNILFRDQHPILLDAECATMGDPSFDVAFCLNHLILKGIHMPEHRAQLFNSAAAFWNRYASRVSWEPCNALQARVCNLLPALMLARVDGKSPVEYLSEKDRKVTREIALTALLNPKDNLDDLISSIAQQLTN